MYIFLITPSFYIFNWILIIVSHSRAERSDLRIIAKESETASYLVDGFLGKVEAGIWMLDVGEEINSNSLFINQSYSEEPRSLPDYLEAN